MGGAWRTLTASPGATPSAAAADSERPISPGAIISPDECRSEANISRSPAWISTWLRAARPSERHM